MARARSWLEAARRVAVLTGAGISKESGVPTFRDAQEGLWAEYDPETLASVEGFRRDPALVWRWYLSRRQKVEAVTPNPGHEALVTLARRRAVTIITQNVDGLHQAAGSEAVIELHGNIRRYRCLDHAHPVALAQPEAHERPPACPRCGSLVRPDVVWFGELLSQEAIRRSLDAAIACDLMLIVGTSGMVFPAAALPGYAREHGARTIEINPVPTVLTDGLDLHLEGAAGVLLPQLVAGLG